MKDKVALVTGGSRGIGRAISRALAEEGVHLAINYLSDHESAEDLRLELEERFGGQYLTIQAHLGDPQSRKELWQKFDDHFGSLDFFVASAATGVFKPAGDLSANSLRKVMAVNVEAFLDLSRDSVRRMRESGEAGSTGRVVALSSLGAERAIKNYGSIAASKAAMEALVRQLASELGPRGVNVNCVRAGLVDTGILSYLPQKNGIIEKTIQQTPNARLVTPREAAELVKFVLSEKASMINGQTMTVDGGFGIRV